MDFSKLAAFPFIGAGQYKGNCKPMPEYHVKICSFDEKVVTVLQLEGLKSGFCTSNRCGCRWLWCRRFASRKPSRFWETTSVSTSTWWREARTWDWTNEFNNSSTSWTKCSRMTSRVARGNCSSKLTRWPWNTSSWCCLMSWLLLSGDSDDVTRWSDWVAWEHSCAEGCLNWGDDEERRVGVFRQQSRVKNT